MNRYLEYVSSESYWFDEVPSHWEKTRNKFIFYSDKSTVGDKWGEFDLLTMGKGGVRLRDMDGRGKFPESFENYQIVKPNQLIFCLFDMDETPRTVGFSNLPGMITSAYDVFSCKNNVNPKFVNYFYQSIDDVKGLRPYYTGLRKVVRPDAFMAIPIYIPPINEQNLISNYLDKKISQIDSLIEKIEQKIELLKEQRTSLINQCVTKGLDPDVEMKDSGVEWIGEMLNHWELKKLKYIVSYNTEALTDKTDPNYEFTYIEISDVDYIDGISYRNKTVFSDSPSRARRVLRKGDVVISTVRTYLRAVGLIDCEDNLIGSTGFCVLRNSKKVSGKYLSYAVRSEWFISDVISNSDGVSYPAINSSDLVNLKVTLPPLNEQIEIENILDAEIERSDDLISKETKRIELLKEYRQSLISNVVTGKMRITEEMI